MSHDDDRALSSRAARAAVRALAPAVGAALLAAACDLGGPGGRVAVLVDGEPRAEFTRADVDAPLDLALALGIDGGEIRRVEIRSREGRPLSVADPLERYPKRTLALFPTDEGLGAGFVDHVLGKLPERLVGLPAVARADAVEVHLRVAPDPSTEPRVEPAPLALAAGGETLAELVPSDLERYPSRSPMEVLGLGGGMQTQAGLFLGDLIAAHADPARVEAVVLHLQEGGPVELAGADVREGTGRAALLRQNRRGQWRLKVWEPDGDRCRVGGNLRGLERIELRLSP